MERSPRRIRSRIAAAGAVLVGVVLAAALGGCAAPSRPVPTAPVTTSSPAAPTPAAAPTLPPQQVIVLPAAVYKAVIPGLLGAPATVPSAMSFTLVSDAPLYGDDRTTPIARLPLRDFLNQPTTVVRVAEKGAWSLVLTPARRVLPSQATSSNPAVAQTAAWVPTHYLQGGAKLVQQVHISVSKQTLTITGADGAAQSSFAVGVGTPDTPTPTGTVGYIQERYTDPDQGQVTHKIQLTSLHATGADEPYGGSDGGLIGIHYEETNTGAVSHGCVRMTADGVEAVDALPLGTLVFMEQ